MAVDRMPDGKDPQGTVRKPLSPEETARRRPPPYFAIEGAPDPALPPARPGGARLAKALRVPRKP